MKLPCTVISFLNKTFSSNSVSELIFTFLPVPFASKLRSQPLVSIIKSLLKLGEFVNLLP